MGWKHITEFPAEGVRIDYLFAVEGGKITKFSINLSVLAGGEARDVYRVDTAHGRLHEQRFWRTGEPLWLEETGKTDYTAAFLSFKKHVGKNWLQWTELSRITGDESWGKKALTP
ncbi:MAG: hypothetical protein NTY90_02425 [Candidatus Micrarchaeota archaeon]|nr:hypothetical protein [Candidatus Micrarchaeota archaeon]